MVAVVIPAAGSGSRLGGVPKQLRVMGHDSVLYHTVRTFDHHPAITQIVVAAASNALEITKEILMPMEKPCQVVSGGATRQESVQAGLNALNEPVQIVLIHDAARPFVSEQLITKVVASTETHGAAAVALPVADTVRYGERGFFTESISREGLYAMQTPQGFKYDLLMDAFQRAKDNISAATDDVALLYHIGKKVKIIDGDQMNFKITTQSDWEWALKMWKNMNSTT